MRIVFQPWDTSEVVSTAPTRGEIQVHLDYDVKKPSWRGDDDVRIAVNGGKLVLDLLASENDNGLKADEFPQLFGEFQRLQGKFASGSEDQTAKSCN